MALTFKIPITAVPKSRPRTFTTSRGISRTYTPLKTKNFESKIQMWLKINYQGKPIGGPLSLDLTFFMLIPKSYSKKKRSECLSGNALHSIKPDLDNLEKSVMDAAEGVLYANDSQIAVKTSTKKWSEEPLILLTIEEVKS